MKRANDQIRLEISCEVSAPGNTKPHFQDNEESVKKFAVCAVVTDTLNLFPPVTPFFVCSLICLLSKVANIPNNMDPDLTALWSGFIVFASMIKSSLKCH